MSTATVTPSVPLRQDAGTISLVGLAHGCSHFSHMLLPPLFPWFIGEFSLTYSELGLLVTAFFIVSGIGQAVAGFLVDRIGARPVLFTAMGCFVAAALAAAMATGYFGLMLAAVLAGLGNGPFHPVDFTILNKRVSPPRLGHAFSAHGISGNLGWALAPVFLAGITTLTGSWRVAYLAAALLILTVVLVLWWQRDALDDRKGSWAHDEKQNKPANTPGAPLAQEHPMAFLRLPSVWLCFSFFFWTTCSLAAIQSFASPALQQIYGLPLATTALVVTGYMLFSAVGMIGGGFLVAHVQRLELIIGACLMVAAGVLVFVSTGWPVGWMAALLVAMAGLGVGLAGPSRDMLIKRAAPPGATGRVYGTVYSGLDLGFAVSAPVFGWMLDHGAPSAVFYSSALTLVVAVLSAGLVGGHVASRRMAVAQAGT